MSKSSDCPDKCCAEGVVDFDHLSHYGPITDDYGNEVWLPVDDYLRELLTDRCDIAHRGRNGLRAQATG